jgi:hypothetical protein
LAPAELTLSAPALSSKASSEVRTGVRTPGAFPARPTHLTHATRRVALNHAAANGPGRIRTCDLGIKSPLLCQLSYRPPGKGYPGATAILAGPGPHRLAAQVTALSRL